MKKEFWTKKSHVFLIALFCCALWGSAAPFIKVGYSCFHLDSNDTASILIFAGARFTVSGILVVLSGSMLQKRFLKPSVQSISAIGTLALFQTFGQYLFYYVGLAHTSAVNGAILTGTSAFISLLVAALIFRFERLNTRKIVGCLFGFAGILLMNIHGLHSISISVLGDGLVLCSQLCSSFSAAFIKKFTQKWNAVMLSGYQFLSGGIALMIVGFLMGGTLSCSSVIGWLDLLYLSFISACAYTLWGILLEHNPVSSVGIYGCFIPIVGVLLSNFILHEEAFSFSVIGSLLLICTGIYLVSKQKEVD